jgi:hypothetical protein
VTSSSGGSDDEGAGRGAQQKASKKPRRGKRSSSSSGSSDSSTERDAGKRKQKKKGKSKKHKGSSSSSDDDGRIRACKFNYKHDDKETNTIFWQISSNVPWLHSRNGQKAIWRHHLSELHNNGHATELISHKDALKTFISWAAAICKARRTFRLAQARTSGIGAITLDYVDDVSERWELKVLGDSDLAAIQGEKAVMMRDAMCSTAGSLDAKTAKLVEIRAKRYAVKNRMNRDEQSASQTPSKTATTSTKSSSVDLSPAGRASPASPAGRASPASDARSDLLQSIKDLTTIHTAQEEKDREMVAGLFASITTGQHVALAPAASQLDEEIATLRAFLQQEDASLCAWAPAIHAALGVSSACHFQEISVSDITNAAGVGLLQKNRLLTVARRHGVKE